MVGISALPWGRKGCFRPILYRICGEISIVFFPNIRGRIRSFSSSRHDSERGQRRDAHPRAISLHTPTVSTYCLSPARVGGSYRQGLDPLGAGSRGAWQVSPHVPPVCGSTTLCSPSLWTFSPPGPCALPPHCPLRGPSAGSTALPGARRP